MKTVTAPAIAHTFAYLQLWDVDDPSSIDSDHSGPDNRGTAQSASTVPTKASGVARATRVRNMQPEDYLRRAPLSSDMERRRTIWAFPNTQTTNFQEIPPGGHYVEEAEQEVLRLNRLNEGRGCVYF